MSGLRVGVDATSWTNRRGYGRFARNVVRRLVDRDPDTTYVLYIDERSAATADLPAAAEVRRVRLRDVPTDVASAGSSRRVGDLARMTLAVRRDGLDAFVFPSVYTYYPVLGVPTVVGVHDAIASELPALALGGRRSRFLWNAKQLFAVRRARRVFTVSEASRSALAARFRLAPDRLAVVPEAPDAVFRPASGAAIAAARADVGLGADETYVLYAGGISPHKDLGTLLEAHALLGAERPRLVLVGELESETYLSAAGTLRGRIATLGLVDGVLLPGFVSDETLAALYSGAAVVVNPSLAEGFGLPAVEAAACGAALVLSDLPAHRETLGEGALFFPPRDVGLLVAALQRVLGDEALRADLGRRGRNRVAPLSWDVAADRLRDVIAAAANGQAG